MRKLQFFVATVVFAMNAQGMGADAKSQVSKADFKSFKEAYAAGNLALKDRKFQEAVADYEASESLATTAKGRSQAANAAGWAYLKARKWEEAKSAFGRSAQEDPQNRVALKNLGVASFRLYEYGFAGSEELKSAVKNLEESGENEELLERAKGVLAREESYVQAAPMAETNASGMGYKALLALGDSLQLAGKFDQALKVFQQGESAAASPKGKGTAANRQGMALLDARRPHESVAHFERAVKFVPEEKVFLGNLGFGYWVLYDSGKGTLEDLKKSVDKFYKANSIDPSYHPERIKMALDELREVDPESAKAYSVKEETYSEADEAAGSKDKDDSK